jgi:hypothetical protein
MKKHPSVMNDGEAALKGKKNTLQKCFMLLKICPIKVNGLLMMQQIKWLMI